MRHSRRLLFSLLAAAFLVAPACAWGQTATTPTVEETQSFSLYVPQPKAAAVVVPRRPTNAVAVPNRSVPQPAAAAAPLPRALAYTGFDPWPIIAGGLALVALSLLARRWTRGRLRARAEA